MQSAPERSRRPHRAARWVGAAVAASLVLSSLGLLLQRQRAEAELLSTALGQHRGALAEGSTVELTLGCAGNGRGVGVASAQAETQRKDFTIAAQSAASALNQFAGSVYSEVPPTTLELGRWLSLCVARQQGEEFFNALYRQGKRARFIRYWGEGHGIRSPANARDLLERIQAWFEEVAPPIDGAG